MQIGPHLPLSAPVRRAAAAPAAEKPAESVQLSDQARRYYDPERDQLAQQKYYSQLPPKLENLNPQEFYRKLNGLLKRTHTRELAYEPSQNLYPVIDRRPDGTLQSIYQAVAQGPLDAVGIGARLAAAQNQVLNCEHAVPRIYFDDKQPMRGDLHHLFTCEETVNSARSSRPYVDFPEYTGGTAGYAPDEWDGFEPGAGKGAVARATLYFLVRYPGEASRYDAEDVKTFLQWHQEEPPGLYEQHRNAEIARRQGNRNPFIDHPEWAEKVDFRLGLH